MPNYRRAHIPGGCFFFTLVTHSRRRFLTDLHARSLFGSILRRCQARRPFTIDAIVLLPDHLHTIWTLPPGDTDYSARWAWIKREFTHQFLECGGQDANVSNGRTKERRRGVWQPRFWEHVLETVEDFEHHLDYIHYNPVKHLLVRSPCDWPWSSFHRWVKAGVYDPNWARGEGAPVHCIDLDVGEPMGEGVYELEAYQDHGLDSLRRL